MPKVHVHLGERSYDIIIAESEGKEIGPFARERTSGSRALVVTDEHLVPHLAVLIRSLEQSGFQVFSVVLPPGEAQKNLASASTLYDRLADQRADRRTLVVALGGGVIGDLAGFVAATWNRGLPLLMVPTSLLAMVDSSVGGKVGVNHPKGKNLIGAFHQPVGVWIDPSLLSTLPEREYRSGLAEVVKYGVILDPEFFAWIEDQRAAILARDREAISHMVTRSCRLKADVVEKDERELTGLRAVLNYGHTFAHAFETVGGYGNWLHGETVSAGMICASRLAERRGLIPAEVTERQLSLLRDFGLPVAPLNWPTDELLAVMRSDKKNVAGRLRFVLPVTLGEVRLFDDVPEDQVREVLPMNTAPSANGDRSELPALLDNCKAHPEDDTPRLALADWLEQHGQPERAEHVRLQVRLERLDEDDPEGIPLQVRIQSLEEAHKNEWLAPLLNVTEEVYPDRGLVHLHIDPEDLLDEGTAALAETEAFAWVESLVLDFSDRVPKDLEGILDSPWLGKVSDLSILGEELPGSFTHILADSARLRSLKGLTLSADIRASGLRTVLASPHLGNLSLLDVSECVLGRSGGKALATSLLLGQLSEIDLSQTELGDEGLATLVRYASSNLPRRLSLNQNGLDAEGIEALAGSPLVAPCTKLALMDNEIGADGVRALANSPHLANLADLDLRFNKLDDRAALALAASERLTGLTVLDLTGNKIRARGMAALAGSAVVGGLTWLGLSEMPLGPEGVQTLFASARFPQLIVLDLEKVRAGDEGAGALADFTGAPLLRLLDLSENRIGPKGAKGLARFPGLSRLTRLDLTLNRIRDEGLRILLDALQPGSLLQLDLWGNKISLQGARALADCEALTSLVSLDLDGNRIGNKGSRALASSPYLANLLVLRLADNHITDEGARALLESPYLSESTCVYLENNDLSLETEEALRERFRKPLDDLDEEDEEDEWDEDDGEDEWEDDWDR
jgi:3-dehydroquinate synthase